MPEYAIYANPMSTILFFDILRLLLVVAVVLLTLRVVLRVEKKLDLFFKILLFSFILVIARQVFRIFINLEVLSFYPWLNWLDIAPIAFILLAMIIMNSLVSTISRDK